MEFDGGIHVDDTTWIARWCIFQGCSLYSPTQLLACSECKFHCSIYTRRRVDLGVLVDWRRVFWKGYNNIMTYFTYFWGTFSSIRISQPPSCSLIFSLYSWTYLTYYPCISAEETLCCSISNDFEVFMDCFVINICQVEREGFAISICSTHARI